MSLLLPLGTVAAGMSGDMAGNFATVFIFVLVGFAFAGIALVAAKILRPSNPSPAKMTTYECGELPTGVLLDPLQRPILPHRPVLPRFRR